MNCHINLKSKRLIIFWVIALLLLGGGYYAYRHQRTILKWLPKESFVKKVEPQSKNVIQFNDLQEVQGKAAKKNGISKLKTKAEIQELIDAKKLVKIENTECYQIDRLTHSYPYLVPKAAKLLEDIGKLTQQKAKTDSKIIVTSVLRTEETVRQLQKTNPNVSKNSCHMNGTTFDITYVRYKKLDDVNDDVMIKALSETLKKLRAQGRCYVKFERKQRCYHITVK